VGILIEGGTVVARKQRTPEVEPMTSQGLVNKASDLLTQVAGVLDRLNQLLDMETDDDRR
jgi:hypothetical protein